MIRPSMLGRAELCGLAPVLALAYPETSAYADDGSETHRQIKAALTGGSLEELNPEATAAVAFVHRLIAEARADTNADVRVYIEHPLVLRDPESGEVLTEGTGDVVLVYGNDVLSVDWKTGRQEGLPHPNENKQIRAYAAAAALEFNKPNARGAAVLFRDGEVVPLVSDAYDLWDIIDQTRAINRIGPEARPGIHCQGCFQRHVCPSWRERAVTGLALLGRGLEDPALHQLDPGSAAELLVAVKAVREAADNAESMVRSFVQGGGRVEKDGQVYDRGMVNGRRSGPSVQDLETLGLTHLIRPGRPYEQWRWRRA